MLIYCFSESSDMSIKEARENSYSYDEQSPKIPYKSRVINHVEFYLLLGIQIDLFILILQIFFVLIFETTTTIFIQNFFLILSYNLFNNYFPVSPFINHFFHFLLFIFFWWNTIPSLFKNLLESLLLCIMSQILHDADNLELFISCLILCFASFLLIRIILLLLNINAWIFSLYKFSF